MNISARSKQNLKIFLGVDGACEVLFHEEKKNKTQKSHATVPVSASKCNVLNTRAIAIH
jgi:hypothetical protein